jgi:hypothetical protein
METKIAISNRLINSPNVLDILKKQIALLHILKGQEINEITLTGQSALLKKEIEKYFPSLEPDDLETAFNNGVRGEYGDYMGLNIITYNAWIKAYRAKPKATAESTNIITKEQIKEGEDIWIESMQKQFAVFKVTGAIDILFPITQYKLFVDYGLLKENDYKPFLENAKAYLLEKKKADRIKAPAHKIQSMSDVIRGLESSNADFDKLIESQAKQDCIAEFYRGITKLEL